MQGICHTNSSIKSSLCKRGLKSFRLINRRESGKRIYFQRGIRQPKTDFNAMEVLNSMRRFESKVKLGDTEQSLNNSTSSFKIIPCKLLN